MAEAIEEKKNGSETPTVSTSSMNKEGEERATWGHTAEFLLSTVGYAVGLGNLWRFPYLCFRNGGAVFLIPYFAFLFLCGIPLVFMEMTIGQFAGAGPLSIWAISPIFKGLGIGMVIVSVYCCIYYNIIIMWTLYYFFHSFFNPLPWANCGEEWNTDDCRDLGTTADYLNIKDINSYPECPSNLTAIANTTKFASALYNASGLVCSIQDEKLRPPRPPYAAEEFWDNKVLSRSGGITETGIVRWDLALTLLLAWVLVFLCLIKGIKSSGKVVYVTATLPYILLTVLLIQGATMKGSLEGVKFYMQPRFKELANPSVWAEACGQIFFSLGAAWGGLITMASYNKFDTNVYRFSIAVPLINCGTSVYAGFVIFCVLGYMADQAGVRVQDITDSGPGLIFVAYPYAISNLPIPQLWAVLFFLMVLTVGLDSQFGMFETFTTCIFDEWPVFFRTRLRKMIFTATLCFFSYLVGLLCCTNAGIYFFQLMDWYIGIFTLMFISLIEVLIVSWVYGADRLYRDLEMMIGYQPVALWKYMWKFVTPFFISIMVIYSLVTYKAPLYKGAIKYPAGAIALAWIYGISSSMPIPCYAAFLLWKTRNENLSLWERIKKYVKPSPEWGTKKHQLRLSHSEEGVPLNDQSPDQPDQMEMNEDPERQVFNEKM